jgi:putative transposase
MKNTTAILNFDEYYHIYNRAVGNEKLFIQDIDYRYFLGKLEEYIYPIADFYTYCLLSNHFHFLVRIKSEDEIRIALQLEQEVFSINQLNQRFSNFFNCYTKSINKKYKRIGKLFNLPYKRILVDSDDYLLSLVCYIHRNPIHHKITTDYESYKYSSYNIILGDQPTDIKRESVLEWFGGKEEFIKFHYDNIADSRLEKYKLELE